MPALKPAALYSLLSWVVDCNDRYYEDFDYYEPLTGLMRSDMAWGFEYSVPGTMSIFMTDRNTVNRTGRHIRWNIGEWCSDGETHSLFHRIGFQQHEPALEDRWADDNFGTGLVYRDYFEPCDIDQRFLEVISLPGSLE